MIKLPDAKAIHNGKSEKARQRCEGWNACLAEVQRLNDTAQPKCQKCGDTGMADSGGTQPWGEQILIECDCATAQPVSDGWIFEACENEPCPNGAVVKVIGADIHLCAACSGDKKYSRMKITALPKRLSLPLPAAPGGQDD